MGRALSRSRLDDDGAAKVMLRLELANNFGDYIY
jgi:hypothetical protein